MPKRPSIIPVAVLTRAKLVAREVEPAKRGRPTPSAGRALKPSAVREKVVAVLRKLHPMD